MNRGVIGFIVLVLILTVVSAGVGVYLYDRHDRAEKRRAEKAGEEARERLRKHAEEVHKKLREHQPD